MSWIEDIAATFPEGVKVGKVTDAQGVSGSHTVSVAWDGAPTGTAATWSSSFDVVLSVKGTTGVIGLSVVVLLIQGQPYISDMIVGS